MNQQYIRVVQGDIEYDLDFTLTDADGNVVPLSNATVVFNAQSVSDYDVQFSRSMAVINAASGTVKYTAGSGDFAVAGTYQAQVVVTYGSGEIITFSGIQLVAEARLPVSDTN